MTLLDRETWREVAQSLTRRPTRTLLTGAGVCWGMFMLVVMVAFGRGLQHGVMDGLSEYSAQAVWIWPERTTMPYAGQAPGRRVVIRPDDLQAMRDTLPGVAAISPRNHLGADDEAPIAVRRGVRHGSFSVTGEADEVMKIRMMAIDEGRFIGPADLAQRRKVAFIGAQVRARLFDPDEPAVGQPIVIRGVEFVVGGVFHLARSGHAAAQQENGIIIPWTTLARVFGPPDRVAAVSMLAAPGVDPHALELSARALLSRRHGVHPDDETAFDGWNPYREVRENQRLFGAIETLLWVVGGCTLLAGALGVGNVVLVAVRERTSEIGLRKALGATSTSVVVQIILESLTLTTLFGYLGLVLGVVTVDNVTAAIESLPDHARPELPFAPAVDPDVALVGLVVLVVAGLAASYLPARAAAAIEPVVALQRE